MRQRKIICFYDFLNQIIIKSRPFDILEASDGVVCFLSYRQKCFFKTILSPAYSIESIKKEVVSALL